MMYPAKSVHTHQKPLIQINPIADRLMHAMRTQGLSSAEIAKRAGVKTSFLYDILRGKSTNPSTIKLAQVAHALGISLAYLAGNMEGELDNVADIKTADKDYVTIPCISSDTESGNIIARIYAGDVCRFSRQWMRRQFTAPLSKMRMFCISGDNMYPTLQQGDMVLVDTTQQSPSPPGVFILSDGMGLVAKRLEYVAGTTAQRMRVLSDNPHYPADDRTLEDTLIVGRVVWFSRTI